MEPTSPTSIFRCMPRILPPSYRRLLGSFAYAVDGAAISYARLREAALAYELPIPETGWPARNRLAMFVDSWSMIDHVARARKLISRFPWVDKSSGELNDFIRETRAATQIRNRLNQMDEEPQEAQTIVGTLSWVDARKLGGHTRYAISSGPCVDVGMLVDAPASGIPAGSDVVQFRLRVAEQDVDLDALHFSIVQFAARLEKATANSVSQALHEAAAKRGVVVEEISASDPFDTTVAVRFEGNAGHTQVTAEVHPDSFVQQS